MSARSRAALLVLVVAAGCPGSGRDVPGEAPRASAERRARVAELGSRVMPFDLERTTHVFEPSDDGGVQTVVADAPLDTAQVRLVREHLREEARRFAAGDFDDPARIHGVTMPGLAALRAGHGRIDVRYEDVTAGARIRYSTSDPWLVRALHDWFRAQTSDHGEHAHPPPAS